MALSSLRNHRIVENVIGALADTIRNATFLARISWIWLLVFLLPAHIAYALAPPFVYQAIVLVLELAVYSMLSVAWCRKLLLGETIQAGFFFRADKLVARVIGFGLQVSLIGIFIAVIMAVAMVFAGGPRSPLMVVVILAAPILVIAARLSLAIPAISVGHTHVNVISVWRITRGYTLTIALGLALLSLPQILLAVSGISARSFVKMHGLSLFAFLMIAVELALYYFLTAASLAYSVRIFRHVFAMPERPGD